MMKVFLWRPTRAHFHLELLWQFAIEDRIWFETLNYPVFDPPKSRSRERQMDKKHFSLEENPLKWWARWVFSFLWSSIVFLSVAKTASSVWASEAGIRILLCFCLGIFEFEFNGKLNEIFIIKNYQKNYSEIPSWFHFHSWALNCMKTGNFYREFCE